MNKERMHLVAQPIIDAATALMEAQSKSRAAPHYERIETTMHFCEEVLRSYKLSQNPHKTGGSNRG